MKNIVMRIIKTVRSKTKRRLSIQSKKKNQRMRSNQWLKRVNLNISITVSLFRNILRGLYWSNKESLILEFGCLSIHKVKSISVKKDI